MAYPAAYRRQSAGYSNGPGFQRSGGGGLPKPANDNFPRPPKPANDNRRLGRALRQTAQFGLKSAGRLNPLYRAYDVYRTFRALSDLIPNASPQQGGWQVPAGWILMNNCTPPGDDYYFWETKSSWAHNLGCLTGQAARTDPGNGAVFHTGWHRALLYWRKTASTSVWRWNLMQSYSRPSGSTDPGPPVWKPGQAGWAVPQYQTPSPLWLDPMAQPIHMPAPVPEPAPWPLAPYRRHNPWRSPTEQRQAGNHPPVPMPAPSSGPDISIGLGPGQKPDIRPGLDNPPRRPPPPGEKERKVTIRSVAGVGLTIVDAIGEGLDMLDALYDALPRDLKRRGLTPQEKARDLYRHWDKVDISTAIKNLARNGLIDYAFGQLGNAAGRASRNVWNEFGLNISIQRGPIF